MMLRYFRVNESGILRTLAQWQGRLLSDDGIGSAAAGRRPRSTCDRTDNSTTAGLGVWTTPVSKEAREAVEKSTRNVRGQLCHRVCRRRRFSFYFYIVHKGCLEILTIAISYSLEVHIWSPLVDRQFPTPLFAKETRESLTRIICLMPLTFISATDTMSAVPNSAEQAVFQKSVFDQATATAVRG